MNMMVSDLNTYLAAKIKECVEISVCKYVETKLPTLLDEALDRQRKTVADELVRILLAKQVS